MSDPTRSEHYDVLVVGSGFGGSVTALRLTEKGYRVGVLEAGRRFADDEFAKTSWRVHKFLFAPRLGLYGIQRIHLLPDAVVLCGAGVGGGSLVYANTLYVPPAEFFADPQWAGITDWQRELAPFYDQAARMLGVTDVPHRSPLDDVFAEVAEEMGVGHTFRLTPVGVFFGDEAGKTVPDPFFGGVGPARSGCQECGACMTGCRHNAKNTLPKNYLGLAEAAGAVVHPLTTVQVVRPRAQGGYAVETVRTGPLMRGRRTFTADHVVVAAGTYNTQRLLHRMRDEGFLPRISARLGHQSRTNSESIVGAISRRTDVDFTRGVAITSSFHPDERTHIEPVRYGKGSNLMGLLGTVMTDGVDGVPRWKVWTRTIAERPGDALRSLSVRRWSERGAIALVMQSVDNSLTVRGVKSRLGFRLTSRQGDGEPNPTWIPAGNEASRRIAEKIDGFPMGQLGDLVDAPMTAHFVGGCCIGDDAEHGVIDAFHRVYGHEGLHVVDGSAVSANLGVNPSLTITAQAERAMAFWPNKGEPDPRPPLGASYAEVPAVAPQRPVVPADAPAALRLPVATSAAPAPARRRAPRTGKAAAPD
ncbi:MAG: GMC family oxidoreductase [Actinomycetales bacterium]|nr:GMC family oxidoreductase [Actinomycetales bacterium]